MAAFNEASQAGPPGWEARAASLLDGHYAPPPEDGDGRIWVRTSVLVQSDPHTLYELWSNVEAAPSWHERVTDVRRTGPKTYHWTLRDEPGSDRLEWEFEILASEADRRIAWRSIQGEPANAGEVLFERAPADRGTVVTVLQQFQMGTLARVWETITGRDPKQSVIENLRHFKALAETGEIPRAEPQPHGNRGISGRAKRAAYGENIDVPAGNAGSGSSANESSTAREGAA